MPPSRSLEAALAALHDLRHGPRSAGAVARLRTALRDKSNHLVARAAQIAGEWEARELADDLVVAFARFMESPGKTDKGCAAKAAIAEALYRLGYEQEAVFLRGIRHEQREPVFGGSVDTAAELRGFCALGLVRMNHPDAMLELADLLADAEPAARAAAARALAYRGGEDAAPLLRFKVRMGDADAQVLAECFAALLRLTPRPGLGFVAGYLEHKDDAVQEAAALALGGSRVEGAFAALRAWWEKTLDAELRQVALRAIAMLRQDEALEFLLALVRDGSETQARAAVAALGIQRYDRAVQRRVREAANRADGVDLGAAIAETFGDEQG